MIGVSNKVKIMDQILENEEKDTLKSDEFIFWILMIIDIINYYG